MVNQGHEARVIHGHETTLGASDLDSYQVMAEGSTTSFVAQEFPVERQILSVAGPLDDDLEAGVGQVIQGTVPEDGVVKEAEPFLHASVAGDHEAGDPVPADDQLIEVGGLLGGEAVETQVVQDQPVRRQKGPEGPVDGVVNSGLGHGPEEVVGMAEADRMTGADSRVAQGLGQEGLAHTGGPYQQDVLVSGEELQGEDGVQQSSVQGDGGASWLTRGCCPNRTPAKA